MCPIYDARLCLIAESLAKHLGLINNACELRDKARRGKRDYFTCRSIGTSQYNNIYPEFMI